MMGANHVRVLRALAGCELVAVADTHEERVARAVAGSDARTYADHQRMLAEERPEAASIAGAAGVPLLVGFVERFNPAVRELKRRLDAGQLGRPLQASARRVGPFLER